MLKMQKGQVISPLVMVFIIPLLIVVFTGNYVFEGKALTFHTDDQEIQPVIDRFIRNIQKYRPDVRIGQFSYDG